MDITKDILEYCEKQNWDEDLRQEVYVKLLEQEEEVLFPRTFIQTTYKNIWQNHRRIEERRVELVRENEEEIRNNFGLPKEGKAHDPLDVLIGMEEVSERLDNLSPLLRDTVERVYLDGKTPEEVAKEDVEEVAAVYKRISRAKKLLQGEE
jgi:DNA-directed RNA polymerase specialized sigma24 family protein